MKIFRKTSSGGYSIVELVLILVIVAIVSGMGFSVFSGSLDSTWLREAGQQLDSDLHLYQSKALSQQKEATFVFSPGSPSLASEKYTINYVDNDGSSKTITRALPRGVYVLSGTNLYLATTLKIGVDGGAVSSNGGDVTIVLANAHNVKLTVLMKSSGYIKSYMN